MNLPEDDDEDLENSDAHSPQREDGRAGTSVVVEQAAEHALWTQMNDRAELVAVALAAEAIEVQLDAFPKGVELVVDNSLCAMLVVPLRAAFLSSLPWLITPWYRHFARLSRRLTALASSHSIGCLVILGRRRKMMT